MTEPIIEGDPWGVIKQDAKPTTPSPREVNQFHSRSDVDSAKFAQHHTLGTKNTQASAGDHVHDGKSSKKIGAGLGIVITGSKGGNAALASLLSALAQVIEFTDSTT